ncbi:MAG TPA: hypothetical protein VJ870_13950 [Amycolatopsis sp.]|nr:hypothetical protein [Amycolatopsis sp.]
MKVARHVGQLRGGSRLAHLHSLGAAGRRGQDPAQHAGFVLDGLVRRGGATRG